MFDENEVDRQNALWRISEYGQGAERLRSYELGQLQAQLKAFMAHMSLADILAMRQAIDLCDSTDNADSRAELVDAYLQLFGDDSNE